MWPLKKRRKLKHSLNVILKIAESQECEDLHHKEKQLHEPEYFCPASYELGRHIKRVRDYMLEVGIK
jgi:hypothetical protein